MESARPDRSTVVPTRYLMQGACHHWHQYNQSRIVMNGGTVNSGKKLQLLNSTGSLSSPKPWHSYKSRGRTLQPPSLNHSQRWWHYPTSVIELIREKDRVSSLNKGIWSLWIIDSSAKSPSTQPCNHRNFSTVSHRWFPALSNFCF